MKQTSKKSSSVFCALFLTLLLTLCGAQAVFAQAEMDEAMKANVISTAEGLTEAIIPLSDEEIEAYKASGDAFTASAMEAWLGAREDLGEKVEQEGYDTSVEYSDGQYVATVPVKFEKLNADFVYIIDEMAGPTSMSINVDYPLSTYMVEAAQHTLIGMGTVFAVLIFLSFIISLFRLLPAENKKKAAETKVPVPVPPAAPAEAAADDTELIAVIAAAIAASEGTSTDDFVVRSIRKINRRK